MVAKYREDREEILENLLAGVPPKELKYLYKVSEGTLSRWRKQFLDTILVWKVRDDPRQLRLDL